MTHSHAGVVVLEIGDFQEVMTPLFVTPIIFVAIATLQLLLVGINDKKIFFVKVWILSNVFIFAIHQPCNVVTR